MSPPIYLSWLVLMQSRYMLSFSVAFYFIYCCNFVHIWLHIWHFTNVPLQWRHDERDGASNRRRLRCLLKRLFRRRSKKTSKLRVTGLCEGISLVTGEFPAQRACNAENVSIWWRHHSAVECHPVLPWSPLTRKYNTASNCVSLASVTADSIVEIHGHFV